MKSQLPPPPYSHKGLSLFLKKKNKAFTLAELLITLTIIGVIAALTIPNLMRKHNEHVTVTKVKQAHAMLYHAFAVAKMEHGEYPQYLAGIEKEGGDTKKATIDYLSAGLKIAKVCGTKTTNCRPGGYAACANKTWRDYRTGGDYCAVLENGMLLCVNGEGNPRSDCGFNNFCALLHIDVNGGIKGPNQYSRDDFWWVILKVTPNQPSPLTLYGNKYIGCSGGRGGDDASRNGAVKWILQKGNMDYLHKEVSW